MCYGAATTSAIGEESGAASLQAAPRIIPAPQSLHARPGNSFELTRHTRIVASSRRAEPVGAYLAHLLRRSTGYPLPVSVARRPAARAISLRLGASRRLGREGYRLSVTRRAVRLRARTPEGLFRGVQTLRQLLPAKVESPTVQPGPWRAQGVRIADRPRFAWRGAHLDVSRHFFSVGEVKRYIDLISAYKVNVLHLHLSDDQGWRIFIKSWPRLATYGGSTEVGGGPGGYYTQRDYADLVRYAARRYITVVPEIDTPGHTNATLASYAELNCDGKAPPLYTGIEVGFSSLCVDKPVTYRFLEDVVRELAALTPGRYIHIGGDEAKSTQPDDYVRFIERVQRIVRAQGKRMVGWQEIAQARLAPGARAQYWNTASGSEEGTEPARAAVRQGAKLVMSPANHAYLDMKYNPSTPLGLSWAGFVEVRDSYEWEPATLIDGVRARDIAGVESALWSETLEDIDDVEFMAFPRLPGIAEIGWSRPSRRGWAGYRLRLAAQGPRWEAGSVNFYRSPQVPWPD